METTEGHVLYRPNPNAPDQEFGCSSVLEDNDAYECSALRAPTPPLEKPMHMMAYTDDDIYQYVCRT